MVRLALLFVVLALPVAAEETLPLETARLEVVLDDREAVPFAGEMVLATIRGTYRVRIRLEELALRRMTDFDWVRLGQDRWSEERLDGRMATVVERRVAFFPKRAGTLTIPAVVHKLTYAAPGGQARRALVRSEPVSVAVRPPLAGAGEAWLPVRALELSDTWSTDPAGLDDHEVAHRRVIVRALGATPEMMPRQPPMEARWLVSLALPERRSMQVTPEGPVTTVVWDWSLKPRTGETGVLEEARFPYYDTSERAARTAIVPATAIGYANFADNSASTWSSEIRGRWAAASILGAGVLAATLLSARGRRGRDWAAWARSRLDDARLRRRLRRAVRDGDAGAFRRAALALAGRPGWCAPAEAHRRLAPLDRHLFGPPTTQAAPDLAHLAETLRVRGRGADIPFLDPSVAR